MPAPQQPSHVDSKSFVCVGLYFLIFGLGVLGLSILNRYIQDSRIYTTIWAVSLVICAGAIVTSLFSFYQAFVARMAHRQQTQQQQPPDSQHRQRSQEASLQQEQRQLHGQQLHHHQQQPRDEQQEITEDASLQQQLQQPHDEPHEISEHASLQQQLKQPHDEPQEISEHASLQQQQQPRSPHQPILQLLLRLEGRHDQLAQQQHQE